MHFRRLIGEKVYLSPLDPSDTEKYTEWINDAEVLQFLDISHKIYNLGVEREILEEKALQQEPAFSIVDTKTEKLIGSCDLHNIDYINSTAEIGIMIGDKNYWNRGFGVDATNLLLDYAFNVLNVTNVMVMVDGFNERALRCFEKVGFTQIGRRRSSKNLAGKRYDVVYLDILAEGFESPFVVKTIEKTLSRHSGEQIQILV